MDANAKLHNGVTMPTIALGGFSVSDEETGPTVRTAIDAGYRAVDTAPPYGNEAAFGRAIAANIADGVVSRADLFVITKLWNAEHDYDRALRAYDQSLRTLGLDYVDLYLIHWPIPAQDKYVDAWKALVALHDDQRVRAVGVSNFTVAHLRRLIDETGIVPTVNQVELTLALQQPELRAFHAEHGIVTQAYSPLGQGGSLSDPVLGEIAAKHGRSPAQVALRWHLQVGNTVIPRSTKPDHIAANIDLFGFELDTADLTRLAGLDAATRTGPDPDEFNYAEPLG
jgi:diketogulonate reductase-like aldo/keto reductase